MKANPDPVLRIRITLMRFRIRITFMRFRILLVILMLIRFLTFTLMRIRILASKKKLQTLKKCSDRLIFHTFWLLSCKLMWIRIWIPIQLINLMTIQIRILSFNLMRIQADPDPQHCYGPNGIWIRNTYTKWRNLKIDYK
jgi:hypothetical protein